MNSAYEVIQMKSHVGRMSGNRNMIFKNERDILMNKQRKIDCTKFNLDSLDSKKLKRRNKESTDVINIKRKLYF